MNTDNDKCYLDFDKLFENFADKYYTEHGDEYDSPDDFAKDLDNVYHIWATSPQDVIGGISPSEFFNRIPTAELIDILKGSCLGDRNPSSLLFDRVATEPELIGELTALAEEQTDEKLLSVVVSIINELGNAPAEFYLRMLEREDIDMCIKETCLDPLCERASAIKSELLARAEAADDLGMLEMYTEALTYCEVGDDRILSLLRKLLELDPNVAYVAELVAKYGDERMASDLYAMLDTCDYATFIELRNAIETLGGTVDENYRDFTDDPLYQVIKGVEDK